jgi:hypothetical protein
VPPKPPPLCPPRPWPHGPQDLRVKPPAHSAPPGAPRPSLIHWPAVGAAGAVALALVAVVVVWVATHPGKAHRPAATEQIAAAAPGEPVPFRATRPVLASDAEVEVTQDVFVGPIDRAVVEAANRPAAKVADPPPAPASPPAPPEKAPPAAPAAAPARAAGETYGTSVLFLNNPTEAAEQARREKKLLLVLHVSGNFEDSCFT